MAFARCRSHIQLALLSHSHAQRDTEINRVRNIDGRDAAEQDAGLPESRKPYHKKGNKPRVVIRIERQI